MKCGPGACPAAGRGPARRIASGDLPRRAGGVVMYEPYPATGPGQSTERVPQPRSVRNAKRLMYLGAALEVPGVIIAVAAKIGLRPSSLRAHPLIVGTAIAIGLWLWMAWANGRGYAWARVVAVGIFAFATLDLIVSLVFIHILADMIIDVVIWVVGLAVVTLLLANESAPFYRSA